MGILKAVTLIVCTGMFWFGCADRQIQVTEIKSYELNSLDVLITQDGIEFDREISSDGLGSIKITASDSTTVRLFETGDIDIEDARLIYRGKLKTDDFDGQVFLELHKGESIRVSRAEKSSSFVQLRRRAFWDVLREKLKWGGLQ